MKVASLVAQAAAVALFFSFWQQSSYTAFDLPSVRFSLIRKAQRRSFSYIQTGLDWTGTGTWTTGLDGMGRDGKGSSVDMVMPFASFTPKSSL
ncbi:hypothetical protein BKA80DRAFT_268047 [Phyllosticta citrichinensis]